MNYRLVEVCLTQKRVWLRFLCVSAVFVCVKNFGCVRVCVFLGVCVCVAFVSHIKNSLTRCLFGGFNVGFSLARHCINWLLCGGRGLSIID
jgi:hypothetical protein